MLPKMSAAVVNYTIRYLLAAGILSSLTTLGFAQGEDAAGRNMLHIVGHVIEKPPWPMPLREPPSAARLHRGEMASSAGHDSDVAIFRMPCCRTRAEKR